MFEIINYEFFPIVILAIFQSVFGIGLLLFGTPYFLLLGYSFNETLLLLLPISITISYLQLNLKIIKNHNFIRLINYFCLPFVLIFLLLSSYFLEELNFKFLVSFILIISSFLAIIKNNVMLDSDFFKKKMFLFLPFIGLIHGLTNMGGSFLSIYSSVVFYKDKKLTRYFIAYGYLSMGIIQLFTIVLLNIQNLYLIKFIYIPLVILLYFPSQKLFNYLNFDGFSFIIYLTALLFGIYMMFQSIFF